MRHAGGAAGVLAVSAFELHNGDFAVDRAGERRRAGVIGVGIRTVDTRGAGCDRAVLATQLPSRLSQREVK
jgi:hypothetical protein